MKRKLKRSDVSSENLMLCKGWVGEIFFKPFEFAKTVSSTIFCTFGNIVVKSNRFVTTYFASGFFLVWKHFT